VSDSDKRVVLLVEDDADHVLLLERAFSRAGVRCTLKVVRDGDEAIRYFEGGAPFDDRGRYPMPDLILLDLKLPRRSGFDVLSWIRGDATAKHLPVVVLTTSEDPGDIERSTDLGANSYVVKPVATEAVLKLVRSLGTYWLQHHRRPMP